MFDEVLETLCGENVYFDTAYVLRYIGKETFLKLLEKHGEDRILFATDSPWSNIQDDVAILRSYELQKETEEKLLCENAKSANIFANILGPVSNNLGHLQYILVVFIFIITRLILVCLS